MIVDSNFERYYKSLESFREEMTRKYNSEVESFIESFRSGNSRENLKTLVLGSKFYFTWDIDALSECMSEKNSKYCEMDYYEYTTGTDLLLHLQYK